MAITRKIVARSSMSKRKKLARANHKSFVSRSGASCRSVKLEIANGRRAPRLNFSAAAAIVVVVARQSYDVVVVAPDDVHTRARAPPPSPPPSPPSSRPPSAQPHVALRARKRPPPSSTCASDSHMSLGSGDDGGGGRVGGGQWRRERCEWTLRRWRQRCAVVSQAPNPPPLPLPLPPPPPTSKASGTSKRTRASEQASERTRERARAPLNAQALFLLISRARGVQKRCTCARCGDIRARSRLVSGRVAASLFPFAATAATTMAVAVAATRANFAAAH